MAEIFKIEDNCDKAVLSTKKLFYEGKVFIYPTDTLYGFGANPYNEEAVQRISKIKQRDESKNNILLLGSMELLLNYVDIENERHLDFLNEIWPNPVSVVLKLNRKTAAILKQETAAFRIPNHRFCLKVLDALKTPLISTSVNKSGQLPYVDPSQIIEDYSEEVDAIFYSVKLLNNSASTLIDLSAKEPIILREGKFQINELINKYF
ncbi:MAG: threonylcarbamoyl-AMP synthase [Ignavibacteriaceae bacterium]|nr:threonylcarbamoyl-AMP synthase [Ignavibacteriaceae bacterium]